MKKEIISKLNWAVALIESKTATEADIEDLQRWISYFQHERLIHLIVTVFVGLADILSVLLLFYTALYPAIALTVLLTILFSFYIAHYYTLENNTQKLYKLLDDLLKIWRQR
ncbi:MAG: hypothetical protein LBP51_04580 [Deferribacteraceae bacterium]|jgi:hypothetical protein|nr:hypothetical protein [Deferribacteraceae bacterium]